MRVLVLGAGGIGGYFGARIAAAGGDVTFLVRPARAALLRERGLRVFSPLGDLTITPRLVTADQVTAAYDLVLLCCKAYDLDSSIDAIRPAVGPDTAILPLLNGLNHFEPLDRAFGAHRVLGGLCQIPATIGPEGEIRHMGKLQSLAYGERDGSVSERVKRIEALLASTVIDARLSTDIQQDLWEKFYFLCSLAAMTCLMRGSVADILSADDGESLMLQMLSECASIAAGSGHPIREKAVRTAHAAFTDRSSPFTASMLRDIEGGHRIEAQHVVGDMLRRGRELGIEATLLRVAYVNLQAYQHRQGR